MPDFEFEFNQKDRDLVVNQIGGLFGTPNSLDYIRLTIYPTEAIDSIVDLPNSSKGVEGKAIFFSSLNEQPFNINISQFTQDTIFNLKLVGGSENDFQIYQNGNDVYIKPNEIFNEFELPQGNYKIQIDFLNQLSPNSKVFSESNQEQAGGEGPDEETQGQTTSDTITNAHYQFIIRQISTSRKEVRLKLDNLVITPTNTYGNEPIINHISQIFNNGTSRYQFKHLLNTGTGDHNPIMNYQFDAITDGKDNQSLILKLYEPLPTNIRNLSMVTIEREVLITQIQDIFYFSDVPDIFFGDGLVPQPQEDWISSDETERFQNFDELVVSSSMGDVEVSTLISSSKYGYPNLNTDYTDFENHTFFGSAKKKLENFNLKVKTIQGYYSELSQSLFSAGVSIGGDSIFVVQKRKDLFNKINDEIKSFTPYEKFLYFDGQSESSASAPGLGKNYASVNSAVNKSSNYEELRQSDGFTLVHKNTNANSDDKVKLFDNQYKVQDKPFFNYSSSIYLSFLLKGTKNLEINREIDNNTLSGSNKNGFLLPHDTVYTGSLIKPSVTGSEYRRFVFEASQSYFVPNTTTNDMAELDNVDFNPGSSKITILNGNLKTGSSQIKDSLNEYPVTVVSQSGGGPFFGSVMPAGDLFVINFTSGSGNAAVTQSFITDVRVSLNNPTNVLPFDNVYHTSSTEWTNWYTNVLTEAETFDTNNIHSFENNLPLYIQDSSDFNDMKDFLNLQGEQYDLIRNHIDSLGTLHNRGYKKTNSPPDNVLPVLLSNMGWEAINPFSGSLTDTLGQYLTGITSVDDIKNQTWRKTLNNLLYIYKSKGTKNSVRALLNTYGYPPDIISFQEFGGSTEESNPRIFTNTPPTGEGVDLDLNIETGSFSFTTQKRKLYNYRIGGRHLRVPAINHYRENTPVNTIEFVYKHVSGSHNPKLLEKSAQTTLSSKTSFDLVLSSSSDGASSSFEFRLNNSYSASGYIPNNAVSMSTPFLNVQDGQLWNIMLQRMTSSISGSGTNEYRLHTALQDGTSIKTYSMVSMSISGGLVNSYITGGADSNFYANQNWPITASFAGAAGYGNLFIGGRNVINSPQNPDISGSIAEFRGWATALSMSKFRQHVLNKFSTVGNTINSYKDELVYHFKFNENYSDSSVSGSQQFLNFIDSSPSTTYSDFTQVAPIGDTSVANSNYLTASSVYGFDMVDVTTLTVQDNSQKENDNNIIITPERSVIGNLDTTKSAITPLTNKTGAKPRVLTSPKLELYRSPQTFVNNFILDNLSGFNLETLYGHPKNFYSQSYDELNTFRDNFFDAHPIQVDTNKFIRAHETMFNDSLVQGIKQIIPARTTFSDKNANIGVEIKPTILEKQKYENEHHTVEVNPNTGTGSIDVVSTTHIPSSSYERIPEGTIQGAPSTSGSSFVQPYSASIKISDSGSNGNPYLGVAYTSVSSSIVNPFTGSISPSPSLNESSVPTSKDGTIDYGSIANESYVSVHKNWGTSSSDVQHINFAAPSGSYGTFNTYDIEKRFIFHSVGDTEYYSASIGNSSDFINSSRFYNRLYLSNDLHGTVTYDSKEFATGSGLVTGRMMGKTRYFTTGSDNNIILPPNHVTKFSNPFTEQMINGTQNITNSGSGFLNVRYEDYSSASFYRVKVTGGDNQLIVRSGNPGIGSDDKIIYDDNSGGGGAL